MSIALIVTRGYGNGTLTGTIANVVTRGYTIGEAIAEVIISGRFTIIFGSEDRQLEFSREGRNVDMSAESREIEF